MNEQNVFAGAFVDRWGHRREDPDWLKKALERDDSCFVPVWGDKCLATGEPFHTMLLDRHKVRDYLQDREIIFLGKFRDKPAFAFGLEATGEAPFQEVGEYHDLRYLGSVLPADEANLAAHARALVLWHRLQKFCGSCGSSTRAESGGNSEFVSSPDARPCCSRVLIRRLSYSSEIWIDVFSAVRRTGRRADIPRSPDSSNPARVSKTRYDARSVKRPISWSRTSSITAHNPGPFRHP